MKNRTRKPTIKQQFISSLKDIMPQGVDQKTIEKIYKIHQVTDSLSDINQTLESLKDRTILLDYNDYLRAYLAAHRLASRLVKTSMGSTRRRDSMEILSNTIQGILGEIAVQKFLKEKFDLEVNLDYSVDKRTANYVPSDIASIAGSAGPLTPAKNVSIKSTKFGGIWLDIHGKQKEKSDFFVMTMVGIDSDTLRQFISTLTRDAILNLAHLLNSQDYIEQEDYITAKEFSPVPVIIAGIAPEDSEPKKKITIIKDRKNKAGKLRFREVMSHQGWLDRGVTRCEARDINGNNIRFYGTQSFTNIDHYIVSFDRLKNSMEEWQLLVDTITPGVNFDGLKKKVG